MAFAYDSYTTPSKNNGVLRATLTILFIVYDFNFLPRMGHGQEIPKIEIKEENETCQTTEKSEKINPCIYGKLFLKGV